MFRGHAVDTGQEFVNTRGADSNAEPLEFDSGMGIVPEAIDMTGTHDDCDKHLCMHAYNINCQACLTVVDMHHGAQPHVITCSRKSHRCRSQSLLEQTPLANFYACLKLLTIDVADQFTKALPFLR